MGTKKRDIRSILREYEHSVRECFSLSTQSSIPDRQKIQHIRQVLGDLLSRNDLGLSDPETDNDQYP